LRPLPLLNEVIGQWSEGEVLHESALKFDGVSYFTVRRVEGGAVFAYIDGLIVFIGADRIVAYSAELPKYPKLQSRLLSTILAYWQCRRGAVMLHASAVRVGDGAVGFIADSGMGKSTTSAYFISRSDEMFSDDLLTCRVIDGIATAYSAFPSLRLDPAQVEHFFGGVHGIEEVQPGDDKLRLDIGGSGVGRYCGRALPLTRIYVLERVAEAERPVEIQPLSWNESMLALAKHSFLARLTRAMKMTAEQLHATANIAARVSVKRLVIRNGYENLEQVRDAVWDDAGTAGDGVVRGR